MEKRERLLRELATPLIAALMAGCGAYIAMLAAGFSLAWLPVYLTAFAGAFIASLGNRGRGFRLAATGVVLVVATVIAVTGLDALRSALSAFGTQAAGQCGGAVTLAVLCAWVFSALFEAGLCTYSARPLCVVTALAAIILSLAQGNSITLWTTMPGIAASLAAFAVPGERRGGVRAKAVIPALILALLAAMFTPGGRVTWEPMENLANEVRELTDDYFAFTQERTAFSINDKGYDHAGRVNDSIVAMLGGPANPDDGVVMTVTADRDILLRGTVKRTYTGYSWTDDAAKARYLYYDVARRGTRSRIFGTDTQLSDEFRQVSVTVTFEDDGTSTLFVPAHLQEFDMTLKNAVYYNSIGEIFITRDVQAGDTYSVTASVPRSDEALIRAAQTAQLGSDKNYSAALSENSAVPAGIDTQVYALAVRLMDGCATDAEKAIAIENYLAQNCVYNLKGQYPPEGEDFVSWFLLESKEGYCSYFASAMTVLCRLAGLPARYCEGYYVIGGENVEVTGKNAHAWTEVYLYGIGWTAFDPTARAVGAGQLESDDEDDAQGNQGSGTGEDTIEPFAGDDKGEENTPEPTADVGSDVPDDPTPTPDSDIGDEPTAEPDGADENEPSPEPSDEPDGPPPQDETDDNDPPPDSDPPEDRNDHDLTWLWILLAVLAVAALSAAAVWYIRRRLRDTDPVLMSKQAGSAMSAALVLYRANLTLLQYTGLAPAPGETPSAFAEHVEKAIPNADYAAFVESVVRSRYAGKPVTKDTVKLGRSAYTAFERGMKGAEKRRYLLHRLLRGIGNIENIP